MGCVLEFDSIEDLQARLRTTDYEEIIDKSEATQKQKREEIFALWEQVTQRL